MNVYCLACGTEFATTLNPGEHGYPLNNGVCHPCVREARKPNHRLIAENERLRAALREIASCNLVVREGGEVWIDTDLPMQLARRALGDG